MTHHGSCRACGGELFRTLTTLTRRAACRNLDRVDEVPASQTS